MNYCALLVDWLTLIVLIFTLGSVVWYTVITNRLHKASQNQLQELIRQRRLSVLPTLLPEVRYERGTDAFYLTNIGKGIATNISIQDVRYAESLPDTFYRFDDVLLLRPDDSSSVRYAEYLLNIKQDPPSGLAHFKKEFANSTITLHIKFQDIEGAEYEQLFQMGKGGNKHISLKPISPSSAPA